ncbi:MAG: beta-ketoacyl-[acyl-carrier-protein] synthase II [Anaerolineales bacterium]|nr:MAG: beta-ketoacyl-[acyl-carrier-protein] synthase II [Anaerolineales bacterium]
MQRAVITGLGAITPIGLTVEEFWANLRAGVSGAGPITAFDTTGFPVRIACEVKDFDPKAYMDFKLVKRTHQATQFAIAASQMALTDAGLTIDGSDATSVGVVMNTGGGGIGDMEGGTKTLLAKGPRSISPFFLPSVMPNAVSCLVSMVSGAKGPVITSTIACASGNYAFLEALRLLRLGEARVVIAGGTESLTFPLILAALGRMGPLSSQNDDPQHACRPFDKNRDGFVFGEGAAVMVVETEEHARQRGAHIYAEVAGGAITSDAYHITAPDPSGDGAAWAMRLALENARMAPEEIDCLFAHGTATPLNDAVETRAIKKAFGDHAYQLAVSATKSMVGHTLGAAGAVSALAAVLAIRDGVIPPTTNYETPDPECDLDYVPNVARQQKVNATMINGFGFGGQNVAVIIRKYSG